MPMVRLRDSTYDRLKQHAEPLRDSPNDVIVRLLNLFDKFKVRPTVEHGWIDPDVYKGVPEPCSKPESK